jgi:dipeptidyl aminopeptidase/acylaminoacyl peptidase
MMRSLPLLRALVLAAPAFALAAPALAQDAITYQQPPKAIADVLLAPPTPSVSIDDRGKYMLLSARRSYPGVAELARPELRVAGLRLNPNNFGPSRATYIVNFTIKDLATGRERQVSGLPKDLQASGPTWNRSQTRIAFAHTTDDRIDLYEIDVARATTRRVSRRPLNLIYGPGYRYADDETLLYGVTLAPASKAPARPLAPSGPVAQENLGKAAPSRTYQDLIKSPYDEALFAFYATSQLVENRNGNETSLGKPAIYASVDPSPDGRYLLAETVRKPFSYLVPASGFPTAVSVLDRSGKTVKPLAELPSSETAPTGFDNVQDVQRGYSWRDDEPATVVWVRPLDGGRVSASAEYRDALYALPAPFEGTPRELVKTRLRFRGVTWGDANLALVTEGLTGKQTVRVNRWNPTTGTLETLNERSTNDAYNNPGSPVLFENGYGRNVLKAVDGGQALLMTGAGASPKGNLPFLARLDLATKKSEILWRCEEGYLESVVKVLDPERKAFVTQRESPTEPPNYHLRSLADGSRKPLTAFPDPQPQLRKVSKQKVSYKREDGIDLTATLYLPEGYDPKRDGRLPVLMWAYPREFKSAADAAQVRGSQYGFTRVGWGSPVFWALRGYAVMDEAEFPIVGEGDKQPNDTFVRQLIWNAQAAIAKVSEMGVGDPARVAVGGHSYGAFMTANLLAHSRLFKAGIARSGAYNRTLTPFGFQNEERAYWEAPEVYFAMSPFSYANTIKDALLLIHGDADNNPGTFPIQSERLYNAVKGHGGTVRYVSLPYESHGYASQENLLHMLWEMDRWLERYVKGERSQK